MYENPATDYSERIIFLLRVIQENNMSEFGVDRCSVNTV